MRIKTLAIVFVAVAFVVVAFVVVVFVVIVFVVIVFVVFVVVVFGVIVPCNKPFHGRGRLSSLPMPSNTFPCCAAKYAVCFQAFCLHY